LRYFHPLYKNNGPKNSLLFQLTGTIKRKTSGKNEQVLDKLKVERERGITGSFNSYDVKNSYQYFFSQGSDCKVSWTFFFFVFFCFFCCNGPTDELLVSSMLHEFQGREHLLNLIDTPVIPFTFCRVL